MAAKKLFCFALLTTGAIATTDFNVQPFKIDLSGEIPRLHSLVNNSRLPAQALYDVGQDKGIELDFLAQLKSEWVGSYDWESQQAELNEWVANFGGVQNANWDADSPILRRISKASKSILYTKSRRALMGPGEFTAAAAVAVLGGTWRYFMCVYSRRYLGGKVTSRRYHWRQLAAHGGKKKCVTGGSVTTRRYIGGSAAACGGEPELLYHHLQYYHHPKFNFVSGFARAIPATEVAVWLLWLTLNLREQANSGLTRAGTPLRVEHVLARWLVIQFMLKRSVTDGTTLNIAGGTLRMVLKIHQKYLNYRNLIETIQMIFGHAVGSRLGLFKSSFDTFL
ncbi:hypothetical protein FB45DRAFT_1098860 [Roridomyces roridus]|uniref:Epoxide hydrolase N-terminal domain-containing protein n=1 Tax=Roridomyces roridus TaxID=1738132 RepID=A0AAD7FW28_9AGAR|nr:hypothetical protein FB45DRAFT_1098860 [Roridomyces roridus]